MLFSDSTVVDIDMHGAVYPAVLYILETLNLRHDVERMPYNPSIYFFVFDTRVFEDACAFLCGERAFKKIKNK